MSFTSRIIKFILIAINMLWGLVGVLFLVVAGFTFYKLPFFLNCLMFVIGGVCLFCALLGCCGINMESVPMTIAYAVLILADLIMQTCCLIFSFKIKALRKYAAEDVEILWNREVIKAGPMDNIQNVYQCCGKTASNDYVAIKREVPISCYYRQIRDATLLHRSGCIAKLEDVYENFGNRLGYGTYATIAVGIIILVFAVYLIMRFRRKQRENLDY